MCLQCGICFSVPQGAVKAKPKYTVKTFDELTVWQLTSMVIVSFLMWFCVQKSKRWVSLSESRSHTAMKVIDRTGPRPRELSSYEEIYDRPLHPEQKMPGILYCTSHDWIWLSHDCVVYVMWSANMWCYRGQYCVPAWITTQHRETSIQNRGGYPEEY